MIRGVRFLDPSAGLTMPFVSSGEDGSLKLRIAESWPHDLPTALHYADKLAQYRANNRGAFPPLERNLIAEMGELAAQCSSETFPLLSNDTLADEVVSYLKDQVDAHRWGNVEQAKLYAAAIVWVANRRGDARQLALGRMAEGDTLVAAGGNAQTAWNKLEEAAGLYLQEGDLLGWGRTCTGRVGICVGLNRVDEAMFDAELAQVIFAHYETLDLLIRLTSNRMATYNNLGRYREALEVYNSVADKLPRLGDGAQQRLGIFYNNVGVAHLYLGNFHDALEFFGQARANFDGINNANGSQIVTQNIAFIEQSHGHYQRALHLLHTVLAHMDNERSIHVLRMKSDLVECYLQLNRHLEARELAGKMIREFYDLGETYVSDLAQVLCQLATAEASLCLFDAAQRNLQFARDLFASLGSETWIAIITLQQARIGLQQGYQRRACPLALKAADYFQQQGQQVNFVRARVVQARALLELGDWQEARQITRAILPITRRSQTPELRYHVHMLLARIAEHIQQPQRARRHYRAAAALVQQVQSSLTITLRSWFLEDKTEPMRALIRLAFDEGHTEQAFETLEWAKSQTLLSYLANREQFYWRRENPDTQVLLDKLDRLRARYHWLYRLAHDFATVEADEPTLDPDVAASELASCEQQIRQITEQLYLDSADETGFSPAQCPGLTQIQARLAEDDLLLAYYDDGQRLSVFAITHKGIQVERHIAASEDIDRLMQKSAFNIRCALTSAPDSPSTRTLSRTFQRLSAQLYDELLRPVESHLEHAARIFVVPYGRLHYLPFHLLHDGEAYLIEQFEMVVLPSAGLLTQTPPRRPSGARVLAHSYDGRLPETLHEASLVGALLPGEVHLEDAADRKRLTAAPVQILHIAAHGKHRMDYPELSYLRLADGELFSDDLLQYDLSYELVTLSACETGQAVVTAGEDLIGLGRGVLVAGAGALIASLWSVHDRIAPKLMRLFYEELLAGASKSAALRQAQREVVGSVQELHPAFWGAFQLIGDPRPLSDFGDGN